MPSILELEIGRKRGLGDNCDDAQQVPAASATAWLPGVPDERLVHRDMVALP